MNLKQLVMIALQVSVIATVFGFGLAATAADLLYVLRRPGLLARSLLSVFVAMPVVAVMLARLFNFPLTVEIALAALAISPVPPLLPNKEAKAGGHASFGLGLMAVLALLSIATVPAALELVERASGRPLTMTPGAVARVVAMSALLPLGAGIAFRALLPGIADKLKRPLIVMVKSLLPLAVGALLWATLPALGALLGDGTLLAMVIFVVAGIVIGHILGGGDPEHSTVLALSTSCRHPAIALAIASTNFPDQRFAGTILLYILVSAILGVPYVAWQRSRARAAAGLARN